MHLNTNGAFSYVRMEPFALKKGAILYVRVDPYALKNEAISNGAV